MGVPPDRVAENESRRHPLEDSETHRVGPRLATRATSPGQRPTGPGPDLDRPGPDLERTHPGGHLQQFGAVVGEDGGVDPTPEPTRVLLVEDDRRLVQMLTELLVD